MGHGILQNILVLLAFAVFLVPLAHRFGLGAVLGYLFSGILVGPSVLNLVSGTDDLSHVSEMGVVFLLFIIGLELEPKRLWSLRSQLFGTGLLQMSLVALTIAGIGLLFGFSLAASIITGVGFSLSSTAIAAQVLKDRNLLSTPGGQSAFAVLLFQDIAVIPLMALLPLLAVNQLSQQSTPSILGILLAILAVIVAGKYLLRHIFRLIASTHLREIFSALCLLFVLGLAALMQSLGASMALGAFLGGVLLANSEYRHAIETDIEPFKGLLLGLFFMTVGMTIDLQVLWKFPIQILFLLSLVLIVKLIVHAFVGRLSSSMSSREIPFFSLVLSQVGEFSFVFFALSTGLGIFTSEQKVLLSATAALSMMTTPLLCLGYDRWLAPRLRKTKDMSGERVENDHPDVLIAGFGRVGQIVARILFANRMRATVLDHDPDQIELVRQFGFKVYYGDATRLDLLVSAGAETAKILVVAVDDVEDSIEIIDLAQKHFPHLQIVARARNVGHVYELLDRKIKVFERETFESSLRMGVEVLKLMGFRPYQAVHAADRFREHNLILLEQLHLQRTDQSKLLSLAKQAREDLEKMFAGEETHRERQQTGWDSAPQSEARVLNSQ